jgi:hypothetical protein
VTTTFPVVAPVGTVAVMLLAVQLVIVVAAVPLNFTLPVPCDGPKFDPAITMDEPIAPAFGVSDEMLGAAVTVNVTPLLAEPTVTTTFPVVAPVGTVAVMLDAPQAVVVAVVPLNLTVLLPLVDPKFDPAITTDDPTAPVLGVRDEMLGVVARALSANESRNANAKKNLSLTFVAPISISLPGLSPAKTDLACPTCLAWLGLWVGISDSDGIDAKCPHGGQAA